MACQLICRHRRRQSVRSDTVSDWRRNAAPLQPLIPSEEYEGSSGAFNDEPEWWSGGPETRFEMIELHGFDDDKRSFTRTRNDFGEEYDRLEAGLDQDADKADDRQQANSVENFDFNQFSEMIEVRGKKNNVECRQ